MNENVVIIIANILSVVGNALFTLSAIPRNKTTIITMQTSNHFLSSVAQLLTSAYSGMVQDVVCLFKNVVLIFVKEQMKKTRLIINIICIVLALCVGITLNILLSLKINILGNNSYLNYKINRITKKNNFINKASLL